jgi:hypothetical protein
MDKYSISPPLTLEGGCAQQQQDQSAGTISDLPSDFCSLCGRSTAPFTARRSALLDTLTILVDAASEAHDADGRQLVLSLAQDALYAAQEVAL